MQVIPNLLAKALDAVPKDCISSLRLCKRGEHVQLLVAVIERRKGDLRVRSSTLPCQGGATFRVTIPVQMGADVPSLTGLDRGKHSG